MVKCEQARDENGNLINRCTACVKRGLPCSWSNINKLFGVPWTDQYEKTRVVVASKSHMRPAKASLGKSKYTRRFEEIEDNLSCGIPNFAAQQTREIEDPKIHALVEDKFDIEEEIKQEAELDD